MFIAAMSGVGAVTRAPIGVVRRRPETRQLLERAVEEIHAVAVASGVASPPSADHRDPGLHGQPARGRHRLDAARRPRRPALRARRTERRGRAAGPRAGVEAPVHDLIWRGLLPLERRARGEARFPG